MISDDSRKSYIGNHIKACTTICSLSSTLTSFPLIQMSKCSEHFFFDTKTDWPVKYTFSNR